MMCDRIVSDREAAVGAGGGAGYRIKNKNPTQRRTKQNATGIEKWNKLKVVFPTWNIREH
jgi:hypothetical protein